MVLRGIRLATIGYLGHMWERYAKWAGFAVFFADRLALDGRADVREGAGFAAATAIGVGGLGCWVGGILGDRWGRSRTTAFAMAAVGVRVPGRRASPGRVSDAPTAVLARVGTNRAMASTTRPEIRVMVPWLSKALNRSWWRRGRGG